MTVDRPFSQLAGVADLRSSEWLRARSGAEAVASTDAAPARYGANARPRWPLMLLVCAAHLVALALLASAVIHPSTHRRPAPLRITLVPVEALPPPAAAQPAPRQSSKPPQTPPPLIAAMPVAPVATAAPLVVAPAPPVVVAAPAIEAPAAPAAVAPPAPLVPPDGFAATLHNPAPTYPIEARRKRQQGIVRLRVTISPEGRVQEIAVARTSGFDLLDQAALEAVRGWRFVPGSRGGVPVEAVGSLSIPFKLV